MKSNNKKILFVYFWLALLGSPALAQDSPMPLSLKARVDRGLQRGDLQAFLDASRNGPSESYVTGLAIIAAGKTMDPFWIPHLQPFLSYAHDRNPNLSNLADSAQLALAKLGNKKQLQEIYCEVQYGNHEIQSRFASQKLNYIQGWFSISTLASWIKEDYKEQRLVRDLPGDVVYPRPQELALQLLPGIVPNPPAGAPSPLWVQTRNEEKLAPQRQVWRDWIRENEPSLEKLSPGIDGIDKTQHKCKSVLAHDQHIDHP